MVGATLSALENLVQAGIIAEDPANAADAMARIADAVTHCKFEPSDAVSDEVVLMKILQVRRRSRLPT